VNLTDVDKGLWQLKLFSIFLGVLIFVATLYLPSTSFYRDIDLSPAARETALQNLVQNQQRIGNQVDQLREVLYIVFMIAMLYLFSVSTFMGRVWKDKQKRAAAKDPSVKKPLGLET